MDLICSPPCAPSSWSCTSAPPLPTSQGLLPTLFPSNIFFHRERGQGSRRWGRPSLGGHPLEPSRVDGGLAQAAWVTWAALPGLRGPRVLGTPQLESSIRGCLLPPEYASFQTLYKSEGSSRIVSTFQLPEQWRAGRSRRSAFGWGRVEDQTRVCANGFCAARSEAAADISGGSDPRWLPAPLQ